MKTLIIYILLSFLFSFKLFANQFHNVQVQGLINLENLEAVEACHPYFNNELPTHAKQGFEKLKNSFDLEEDTFSVVSDFTCNMTHLFYWTQSGSDISYNMVKSYRTSGGRGAVNNVKRTGGTPPGVHKIYKKQGDTEGWPLNYAIDGYKYGFKSKVVEPSQDFTFWKPKFVMTRILRLKGLEGKLNNNSVARSILFHGTPEEGLLGYHESGGCIRMNNLEVIDLFDQVIEGTLVNIVYSSPKVKIVRKSREYLDRSQYKDHGLRCVDKAKCEKY